MCERCKARRCIENGMYVISVCPTREISTWSWIEPTIGLAHMRFRSDIQFRLHSHRGCTLFSRLLFPLSSLILPFLSLLLSLSFSHFRPKTNSGHDGRFCMPFRVTRANRHGNLIFTEELITNCHVNMMYREKHPGVALSLSKPRLKERILVVETRHCISSTKERSFRRLPFILPTPETRRSIVRWSTILSSVPYRFVDRI